MHLRVFLFITLFCYASGAVFARQPESRLKGVHNVRLDNGMTLLVKEDHSQPLVTVQVWVRVGSVNESAKTSGLSHFLEHLIFKGTEKYPGDEISRRTETQGGVINAATSKEFTHFYIDIQKDGLKDTIDILADAMANASLPAADIEKERPVVLEEIRRHNDNPGAVLYDLFSDAVFATTPYRTSVIGSSDVISSVTRQEIHDYYKAHYVPSNMVVSIVGDFKAAGAVALAKASFGKQPAGPSPVQPVLVEPAHAARSLRQEKRIEQEYWFGGFLGPVITSDDQFAADLAGTILGGGRSSRLYRILREEKQLVYSIGASFWTQRGSGVMACSAVFEPGKEKEAVEAINAELLRLQTEGPTDAELARAKQMITSQWHFGNETFHDQASLLGYWHMQGNPGMIDRYIPGITKVSKKDIQEFLKKYYAPQGLSQAFLVPKE